MSAPAMNIRRATIRDRSAVLGLHRALYVDLHRKITPPVVARLAAYVDLDAALEADVDALLGQPDMRVLVGESGGRIIGYITARIVRDPRRVLSVRAFVEDWLVMEGARGHGLGRALMERLFDVLAQDGCEMVESSTLASNDGARAAHAKLGFVETDVRMRRALEPGTRRR